MTDQHRRQEVGVQVVVVEAVAAEEVQGQQDQHRLYQEEECQVWEES